MGFKSQALLVIAAIAITFVAIRSSETMRLVGDEAKPGILDLFTNSLIRNKIKDSASQYHDRNTRLSDRTVKEQDSGMVDDYYTIVTDFYEYGWGQSFHFAHQFGDDSFDESLNKHEVLLANKVGITKDHKVIDVGCGVGGPARNIHLATGAEVTGVTINEYQVMRANAHSKDLKIDDKVKVRQMDFTKLDFPDNTFDKAYSIEATCHATDLYDVYKEVFRVLKPNGVFGSYEWLITDKADMSTEAHKKIMRDIEYGSGLPPMHTLEEALAAAKKAGFELVYEHDYALDTGYTKVWYAKLDMSYVSTFITHYFTTFMEMIGLAAEGSVHAHSMLLHAVDGLVAGGKTGTFTPMHMVVFRKPAAATPAH